MGRSCNENGENKNHQKNNRMDSLESKASWEAQVKVDGPGGGRSTEDEDHWLESESRR
jgi:hypothetical protein